MKIKYLNKKLIISAFSCIAFILLITTFSINSNANNTSNAQISVPKTTSNPKTAFITLKDKDAVFGLRIYPKRSTQFNVYDKLKDGTQVIAYSETVVNDNITWVKVKANNKIGWVNKRWLTDVCEDESNVTIAKNENTTSNVSKNDSNTTITQNENTTSNVSKNENNVTITKNDPDNSNVCTDNRIDYWSYTSDESNVTVSKYKRYNSDVYIADIKINDARQFKHVYANSNLDGSKKTVVDMTKKYNPIIAINATGFERDNNNLPMGTVGSKGQIDYFNNNRPSLVMGYNGMLNIVPKYSSEADYMSYKPFWITSFGPLLIDNYTMVQTQKGNANIPLAPRVAIGQKTNANEFIIIVVDGRSTSSPGVNYYQMATMFQEKGARVAYNLDGGGSATLTFNGEIINNPSDATGPREVIDSIFIRDINDLLK